MSALEVVRSVATHGLPGGPPSGLDGPLSADSFASLLRLVERQRLVGLLGACVEDGWLPVDDAQWQTIEELHLRWTESVLQLERVLLEVMRVLDAIDAEALVLKGAAVAHLAYPDPSLRMYGDNDILLRAEDIDRGIAALTDHGYERPAASPRPGFDRRFGKGATLRWPGRDELDVHRTLVFGSFGFRIELEELFASAIHFELGGRELRALGPETRLLHACYHAALGDPDPRLSSLRDVAQLFLTGDHDDRRVATLVADWGADAVVSRAVRLCRSILSIDLVRLGVPLAARYVGYEPTRRERRAIASHVGNNRHHAAKVVASLPYLEGTGAKLAFLRASLAPSDDFVESRGSRPGIAWLGRGLRAMLPRGIR
jgi:hypothetical protein